MTGLIKSLNLADLSAVRSLSALQVAPELSEADEERIAFTRRIAALEKDLRERDAAIETLRGDVGLAYQDGEAAGRQMGLGEAEDQQAARLAILEKAAHAAQIELAGKLASLDRLAALLARDCLDIILGNPDHRQDILGGILRTQLAKIDRAMVLGIELSRGDFADDMETAILADRVGLPAGTLKVSEDMPPGGCQMTLRLGGMDVGINQQWAALRDTLEQMLSDDAP